MAGSLHIFVRSVVNGSPHYQVNYTTAGNTYARVFETDVGLADFLVESGAIAEHELDPFWRSLGEHGHATIPGVHIPEPETNELGLVQAPSDE